MSVRAFKTLFLTLLALVVVTSPAVAQVKWQLRLGPTLPMGDYGDGFGTGFHVMGGANFELTAKPISFRTDLVYNMSKCDVSGCGDITSKLITLSGDVQYNFPTPTNHPYLLGGLTWGHASLGGSDAPSGLDSEKDVGFNVGGGMHFNVGGAKAFVEARYFQVGDADFVPITFGVRF